MAKKEENKLEINKELVERLAKLSRLNIGSEKNHLVDDFKKIINYFEDLKDLSVDNTIPMAGGNRGDNVFREDDSDSEKLSKDIALDQFPEEKDGFLRVPPIF